MQCDRRTRKKSRHIAAKLILGILILITAVFFVRKAVLRENPAESAGKKPAAMSVPASRPRCEAVPATAEPTREEKLDTICSGSEYPQIMVDFAKRHDVVIDYVYEYPMRKNERPEIDLSQEAAGDTVPLLLQWDPRWGYLHYGGSWIGCAGCGPLCLSMAAIYFNRDPYWSPDRVVAMAEEQGYRVEGSGSSWTLISEGAELVGLTAEELPLMQSRMESELDSGKLIILVVGPGDFSSSGHFLLVTGYDDYGFFIHDPNSPENSEKTWPYQRLSSQILNLWAIDRR